MPLTNSERQARRLALYDQRCRSAGWTSWRELVTAIIRGDVTVPPPPPSTRRWTVVWSGTRWVTGHTTVWPGTPMTRGEAQREARRRNEAGERPAE